MCYSTGAARLLKLISSQQKQALVKDANVGCELQLQHHLRGLSDCLPSLTSLLIVHGLLGLPGAQQQQQQQQHGSPEGPSPAQRGHQLMAALMSVELPQDPDQLEASLLHRTARQFHLADAVRQTAQQVRPAGPPLC